MLSVLRQRQSQENALVLFHTFDFLVFFSVVTSLYFFLPHHYRWAFLLGASYVFYGYWNVRYLLIILTSTLVDYLVGIKIGLAVRGESPTL